MKRVLVTGSAGFAASHFVEHVLANTDWDVIGLDSFRHRGDSLRVYHDPKRYTVHCVDLAAPISRRLAEEIGPIDYIVNMASESHVDRSISDPVPFVQNNVNLALNVLEYARHVRPKVFVQISTDEVYGAAHAGKNHREWDPIIPSNPYAASKAAQEAIAISYWRTYGVPLIITNAMNLIGERQDCEKYLPMLISKIQAGETVTVHGSPGHIGSRKYLHCRNMADAIVHLIRNSVGLEYRPPTIYPERYNIVGDVEINNLELATMVANLLGKPLKYEFLDFHSARPGHDFRYSLDGSKLKQAGWVAPVDFKESLKRVIDWTLEHPIWLR